MRKLERRLENLEASNPPPAVPFLMIISDEECWAGDGPTTPEAWEEKYAEQIEEERRQGRTIFGIDFRAHDHDEDET